MLSYSIDGISKKQKSLENAVTSVMEAVDDFDAEDIVHDTYQEAICADTVGDYTEAAVIADRISAPTPQQ